MFSKPRGIYSYVTSKRRFGLGTAMGKHVWFDCVLGRVLGSSAARAIRERAWDVGGEVGVAGVQACLLYDGDVKYYYVCEYGGL